MNISERFIVDPPSIAREFLYISSSSGTSTVFPAVNVPFVFSNKITQKSLGSPIRIVDNGNGVFSLNGGRKGGFFRLIFSPRSNFGANTGNFVLYQWKNSDNNTGISFSNLGQLYTNENLNRSTNICTAYIELNPGQNINVALFKTQSSGTVNYIPSGTYQIVEFLGDKN